MYRATATKSFNTTLFHANRPKLWPRRRQRRKTSSHFSYHTADRFKKVYVEATAIGHRATRAGVTLALGLSNANRCHISAKYKFLSRVLRLFTHRNRFSLSIAYSNSVQISTRRATRSVNVYLNRTFARTLKSGQNVCHCNDVVLPVSRALVLSTISLDNHTYLMCNLRLPTRALNAFSARLIRRF